MITDEIIRLAKKHAKNANNASATVCCSDAEYLFQRGMKDHARKRAIDALAHAVGVLHFDYKRATEPNGWLAG